MIFVSSSIPGILFIDPFAKTITKQKGRGGGSNS